MKKLLEFGRKLLAFGQRLNPVLSALEPYVEGLLYLLSFLAVGCGIVNELVPREHLTVHWLNVSFPSILLVVQTTTWAAYFIDFILFGLASGRPWTYVKRHLVELTICLSWSCVPFSDGVLIQQLQSALSLQTLLLIGTVAHVIRIARGAAQRFDDHPIAVLIAAGAVLVTAGGAFLTQVEPETFKTFQDAAWYVYTVAFDEGANASPNTLVGRLVGGVIMAIGVSLFAIFIATVREIMSRYLFKKGDIVDKIYQLITECYAVLQRVHEALQALTKLPQVVEQNNQLIQKLVEERDQSRRLLEMLNEERAASLEAHRKLVKLLEERRALTPSQDDKAPGSDATTSGGAAPTAESPPSGSHESSAGDKPTNVP